MPVTYTFNLYRNYTASDTVVETYKQTRSSLTAPEPETLGWVAQSGYTFKEWNSSRDGTGIHRDPGNAITSGSWFAIWEADPVPYLTTDVELTSVADAIRSKGGTSSPLVYPSGFVSAVNAIPTSASPSPYTSSPAMDGTASAGSSDDYSRGDHVHPTDTSRQEALVSGTNIKTINNESILGSGNLVVESSYTLPTASSSTKGGIKVSTYDGFVMSGENLRQLIDVSMNGTAVRYISASTSSTVAANMNGWHVNDVYVDPDAGLTAKRACGVVSASAVINTAVGGQYRSSSVYIPLPEDAQGILYISPLGFGCGLGGSAVAGMGALLGGTASSWQYSYGSTKTNINVMLTAPSGGTSSRSVYFPIEVVYIPAD